MKLPKFLVSISILACILNPMGAHAAAPKNPLVLVHGWSGTANYLGFIAYWNGFGSTLSRGGVKHYIASVSSFNSDEVRGRQLNNYVRALRASTGHKKFNLIGHSQGGATIRKTAHDLPGYVKSLTTISTPHLGWKVADWALQQPGTNQQVAAKLGNLVGNVISSLSGVQSLNDFSASIHATSTAGRAEFNRRYPTAGVGRWCSTGASSGKVKNKKHRYYSYTGNRIRTNFLDISDIGLAVVAANMIGGEENDGIVRVCASKFGNYAGNYSWNHMDEINQLFGLRSWSSQNPTYVLLNHARRLASDGL